MSLGFHLGCCCPTDENQYDIYGPYGSADEPDDLRFNYFYAGKVLWGGANPFEENSQTLSGWSIAHGDEVDEYTYLTLSPALSVSKDRVFGLRGRYDVGSSGVALFGVDVRTQSELFDFSLPAVQSPGVTLTPLDVASATYYSARAETYLGATMFSDSRPNSWKVASANEDTFAIVIPLVEDTGATYYGAIVEATELGVTVDITTSSYSDFYTTVAVGSGQDAVADTGRLIRAKVIAPRNYPKAFGVRPPVTFEPSGGSGTLTNNFDIVMGDLSSARAGVIDSVTETIETASSVFTYPSVGGYKRLSAAVQCGDSTPDGSWACGYSHGESDAFGGSTDYVLKASYQGNTAVEISRETVNDGAQPPVGTLFWRDLCIIPNTQYLAALARVSDNQPPNPTYSQTARLYLFDMQTGAEVWSQSAGTFGVAWAQAGVEPWIIGANERYVYVDFSAAGNRTRQKRIRLTDGALENFAPEIFENREPWPDGYRAPLAVGVTNQNGRQVDVIHNYEAVNALITGE